MAEFSFNLNPYKSIDYKNYEVEKIGNFSISTDGVVVKCRSTFDYSYLPVMKDREEVKRKLPLKFPTRIPYKDTLQTSTRTPKDQQFKFPEWAKPLEWLMNAKDLNATGEVWNVLDDVDVVTQRGVLKELGYRLLNKAFGGRLDRDNKWRFEACKYKGKLFLRTHPEEAPKERGDSNNIGYEFEKIVIMPMDNKVKSYFNVLKGNLEKGLRHKKILFTAEVDAVSNTKFGKAEIVEVKTCNEYNYDKRSEYHWIQSYLAGVNVLYTGMVYVVKGDKGKDKEIKEIKERKVEDIPKENEGNYNGMIYFIFDVLEWIYGKIEDENVTWSLEYHDQKVVLKKGSKKFIPDEYSKYREFIEKCYERSGTKVQTRKRKNVDQKEKDSEPRKAVYKPPHVQRRENESQ